MCVNALNGLSSFLPREYLLSRWKVRCQRPKRAYFISTYRKEVMLLDQEEECQRPKRAYFISTAKIRLTKAEASLCQRPKRAYFISTVPSKTP